MIHHCIFDVDEQTFYDVEPTVFCMSGPEGLVFYDRMEFHNYHQRFADEVFCVGVRRGKTLIGYCYLGGKGTTLKSPYSSPFSQIYLRDGFRIDEACVFVDSIKKFAVRKGYDRVAFTLPPEIYGIERVNVLSASFFSQGFKVSSIDLNNYFDLATFTDVSTHLKRLPYKVRKNYRRALDEQLRFEEIPIGDFQIAYDVISTNREQMGYPLKISRTHMEDLLNMNCLVARSFVVKVESKPIASAIVFDVTEEVSQVIYWGDVPEHRQQRPMEFLAIELVAFYKRKGKKYLDIGPSSEMGIINRGLADFKRSIGCYSNAKMSFEWISN